MDFFTRIKKIKIKGYKSIKDLEINPNPNINILIGANGAGKSNFISFFRMLSWMISTENFQNYVAKNGRASAFLFDGPSVTTEINAEINLETNNSLNDYKFRITHGAGDILFFTDEGIKWWYKENDVNEKWFNLGHGHDESKIHDLIHIKNKTIQIYKKIFQKIIVYQFHNTSFDSKIRNAQDTTDRIWLKEDGSNLNAILYKLKNDYSENYKKTLQFIKAGIPFLDNLILEDENGVILLRWKELECDKIFNVSQASDGMIRYIALVTLLTQPAEILPHILFIDEPELGLHPQAIDIISGLIKSVSQYCQVFVATQSPQFIDNFNPENIIVVDRIKRTSTFKILQESKLKEWLNSYTLSELWNKNILGGKP